jgi:tetratricopeptide (TPR) repeat protein
MGRRLSMALVVAIAILIPKAGWTMTAEEYRLQGLAYRQQEKYPEAIAALQKAVALEPKNISGWVILGWTQHRAGQEEAATQTLTENFYRQPFDVPNLNALGIVHLVRGRLSEAVVTHSWAIALKPNNEIAYYNLSLAMERLGQDEWAISNAIEASQLEPTNPHPLLALAIAHWPDNRPQALEACQKAIALDGRYRDVEFLNYLPEAGFSPEQTETAKQILQVVLKK